MPLEFDDGDLIQTEDDHSNSSMGRLLFLDSNINLDNELCEQSRVISSSTIVDHIAAKNQVCDTYISYLMEVD
jgi:hypothetical protein